jgi:hypothetical protein
MGRLLNGPNSHFVGKVGTVIGSTINGRPYLKGPYRRRKTEPREAELANRAKFKMAQDWLRPIKKFLRAGFKGYNERCQGFVAAKSHLLLNAFEGMQPNISINPSLVKVSHGNLPSSVNISVEKIDSETLQFTWDTNVTEDSHPDDQVMLLAYVPYTEWVWFTTTGQFRHVGTTTLKLMSEHSCHIYFAFVAHDRSRQSDSVYLGEITM